MRFKKIYVEITNICNKNCSFCSMSNRPKKEMSLKEFEHVLKEIKPYTNYIYLHIKGEPLLHSKFFSILELTKKYGMIVNITTNGTLLKNNLDLFLNSHNIRQINISLHSFNDEKNYIEDILDVTDKLLNNTSIYVNYRFWALDDYKLSSKNIELIKKIELYFNVALIDSLNTYHKAKISDHLFIEEGEIFDWPTIENDHYSECGKCMGLKTHIGILSSGEVVPCCLDSEGAASLGNIFNKSLSSILESDNTKKIIDGFNKGVLTLELCKHCTYHNRF